MGIGRECRSTYRTIRAGNNEFPFPYRYQLFIKLMANVSVFVVFCLGGGDYAYSAAYSQYSSAPYSGYGYGAATSGLLSK